MNKLKPLILFSIGNITSAKITTNYLDGCYVNTRYDKGIDNIRGMVFSHVILLDEKVSNEYIHYANKRVFLGYDKASDTDSDYTATLIYNTETEEITNVGRL